MMRMRYLLGMLSLITCACLLGCGSGSHSYLSDGDVSQPDVTPSDVVEKDSGSTLDETADFIVGMDADATIPQDTDDAIDTQESGTEGVFKTTENPGFYDLPFPNNYRLKPSGGIDLSGFPGPTDSPLYDQILEIVENDINGFSTIGGIYFVFTGPLNEAMLPDVAETMKKSSSVFLVDIDEKSSHRGEIFPITLQFYSWKGKYFPANTLMIQPLMGYPLRGNTTYAVIIRNTLLDASNNKVKASQAFQSLWNGQGEGTVLQKLRAIYEPLWPWLAENQIANEDIVIATVFTTQDPTAELRAIRKYINESLDPPVADGLHFLQEVSNGYVYEGTYTAPNFQKGEIPYDTEGQFEFDANGEPVIQRYENLRFIVVVPKGDTPVWGFPVAIYSHGTGGSYKSCISRSDKKPAAQTLAGLGIATLCIDMPLHGARDDGKDFFIDLYAFNLLNMNSARTLQRQAAVDAFTETRFLRESLVIPADISQTSQLVFFNPEKLFFLGHSQGGLSGAMFIGIEPHVKAALLSGTGGGLSVTLMLRSDPVPLVSVLVEILELGGFPDELTIFHPAITIVQTAADVTDPLNYAYNYMNPVEGLPKNLVLTEGLLDIYTPYLTTENLAIAADCPIVGPVAHDAMGLDLKGIDPVSTPVQNNVENLEGDYATCGLAQDAEGDHFTAWNNDRLIENWTTFFESLVEGDEAVIW